MPGMADEIEGAMQQAPHPARHVILLMMHYLESRRTGRIAHRRMAEEDAGEPVSRFPKDSWAWHCDIRIVREDALRNAAILLAIGLDYLTVLSDRRTSAQRAAGTNNVG